jgi:hypothetical protein
VDVMWLDLDLIGERQQKQVWVDKDGEEDHDD